MPRSAGVIRPSGLTAEASVITNAAPPMARLPRCTKCQSLTKPSVLEYSHIGETTMRWGKVRLRNFSEAKRWLLGSVTEIRCDKSLLEARNYASGFVRRG